MSALCLIIREIMKTARPMGIILATAITGTYFTRPTVEMEVTRPTAEAFLTRPMVETDLTRPTVETEVTRPTVETSLARPMVKVIILTLLTAMMETALTRQMREESTGDYDLTSLKYLETI